MRSKVTKSERVLTAMTAGIVLTWLSLTDFGVFFLAAAAGVSILAAGVTVLAYVFAGADGAFHWTWSRVRALPHPSFGTLKPRMAGILMKRA